MIPYCGIVSNKLLNISIYTVFIYNEQSTNKCSHPTSFGKKYAHVSFLWEQIDTFLGKFYIFRKVTSATIFLANPIVVRVRFISREKF